MAMIPSAPPAAPVPAPALGDLRHDRSYCDWPAIFAGAVIAAAVSIVLYAFGAGLGLSLVSAEPGEGVSLQWWALAAGIWLVWVAVTSFGLGGYLAGRLRRPVADATLDETESRDGAHGLTVWATGTLVAAVLALGGLGGVMGGLTGTTGSAAGTVAEAMEDQGDYFATLVLRDEAGNPPSTEAVAEARTILLRSLAQGTMSPADRDRLVQLAAAETGLQTTEVEQGVEQGVATFEEARQQAIEVAEQARVAGIVAGFFLGATLLVGAAASYQAAMLGGSHRDRNIPLSGLAARLPARGQPGYDRSTPA
ncbi:MAG: hypothetical protein ACXIU8_14110 [Alkalilacustris sp.]